MALLYDRGLLLYDHRRFALALKAFLEVLAETPNDARAMSMVSLCHSSMRDFPDARAVAEQAIAAQPDFDWGHYALAWTFYSDEQFASRRPEDTRGMSANAAPFKRRRLSMAVDAAGEALRLSPRNIAILLLKSMIASENLDSRESLRAANAGLEIEPSHPGCQRMRAWALRALGDLAGSADAAREALANDPENAASHATAAWTAMEACAFRQAAAHFTQAVRLDPANTRSRAGLVKALRARLPFYRPAVLLSRKVRRAWQYNRRFSTAIYFVFAFLMAQLGVAMLDRSDNDKNATAVLWCLGVVAAIATVVFGLHAAADYALLFHPVGRVVLKRSERWGAMFGCGAIPAAIAANPLWFIWCDSWKVVVAIAVALALGECATLLPAHVASRRRAGPGAPGAS